MARHRTSRAALHLLLLLSTVPVPLLLAPVLYGAPQGNRRQNRRQDEQLDLALGLLQRGMHDDAARRLVRFLRRNPNHARYNRDCSHHGDVLHCSNQL